MKKHLIRNAILMAVATLIMGVFLSLYIANTGTVPAADNAAASTASSQAAQSPHPSQRLHGSARAAVFC